MKRILKGCNHTSKEVKKMADGGMAGAAAGMGGRIGAAAGAQRGAAAGGMAGAAAGARGAAAGAQRAMSGPPARPAPKTQGPRAGPAVQRRFADGGPVNEMEPPERGGKPKKITTPGKPGDSGPGGAHPGRNRSKKKKKSHGMGR